MSVRLPEFMKALATFVDMAIERDSDDDQLHRQLETAEEEGLLERTGEMRDGHPVYRMTPAGHHVYVVERWGSPR